MMEVPTRRPPESPLPDPAPDLAAKVADLTEALQRLERRVAALESGPVRAARPSPAQRHAPTSEAEASILPAGLGLTEALSLGGRTFLVLAGAFVLRHLTESQTLPAWLGVALGLAYAGTWVAMADLAGRAGRPWSAGFHGLAAVAVGLPLLFEAASRFKLLSPILAAVLLLGLTGVALAVAARRRLHGLAWLVTVGGTLTAVALMLVSGRLAPATAYLILLGVATLWLGYVVDWVYLRWPVALAADLVMVFLALRAGAQTTAEGPTIALLMQALLVAGYFGSFAARTLLLQRKVVLFETFQTAAAILVGLGGAVLVATRSGSGRPALGAVSVLFGAAAYAVAFAFVQRHQKIRENFYFYASVALVFALAGTTLLLPGRALAVAWAALAVGAAFLARRERSATLALHASVYGVAAALGGDLVHHAGETLFGSPEAPWSPAGLSSVLVVAGMAATTWLTAHPEGPVRPLARVPRFLLFLALALSVTGLVTGWVGPLLAGAPGGGASPAVLAAVRTAALSSGALFLAWLGRSPRWQEAGWLVYPALVLAGGKILLEDLRVGRPATQGLGFAFFGAALILAPRLRTKKKVAPAAAPADAARKAG